MRPTTSGGGPYFDDLAVGDVFDTAPALTLSAGVAALHQSIVGDRLALALDGELSAAVAGAAAPLAHPALVWDVAIGQSTLVTQRVKANLFYRGLVFHRFPVLGDTLASRTTVVALRANSPRCGRAPTGLAVLRITTADQAGRVVLDFHRCAMLPASPGFAPQTPRDDDVSKIGTDAPACRPGPTAGWDAAAFGQRVAGPRIDPGAAGARLSSGADVVTSAPELARLTLNVAAVHHDLRIGGRRLVYGGHTVGLALAQATRLLPALATVLGWRSCDHTGPVYEGDTLHSELVVEVAEPVAQGVVLKLRSLVYADSDTESEPDRQVLDWRFTALQC